MGPLFLFLYPSSIIERGPGIISLSLLVMGVIPRCAHMYTGVQSWSILLPLVRVGSAFYARVLHVPMITHVTGGGVGWIGGK